MANGSDITAEKLMRLLDAMGGLTPSSAPVRTKAKRRRKTAAGTRAKHRVNARNFSRRKREAAAIATLVYLTDRDLETLRRLGALRGDPAKHGEVARAVRNLFAVLAVW